jgi:sec-independent protein translocase protein TatA
MGLDNPLHIIFIVVILLLLFGAKRLPEIGRSLGTGMREFKQSVTGEATHDAHQPAQQPTLPPATSQQAPAPPPTPQQAAPAPVPSSAQASPQDAFAQREQASTEQR